MGKRRARGTGTIFHHAGRGVWVGRRKVGGKVVERSHKIQSEMLRLLDAATPPGDSATVAAWCAQWLADQSVRPRTFRNREAACRVHVVPALGKARVRDLTPGAVESAARKWAKATSPNTARAVLAVLHTCLQSAVRHGLRPDNPVKSAPRPKAVKKKIDPFTPDELKRIVSAAAKNPAWRPIALLAATGMRVGEALALDAGEFDPDAGTVSINRTLGDEEDGPPKSANGVRTIRVPAPALPAVEAAHGGRESGPLFVTRQGTRGGHKTVRDNWVRLLKSLGLRFRNAHQLRHSVATLMISEGVPLGDVAKYLGDAVTTVVATYLHPTKSDPSLAMDMILGGG